MNNWTPEEIALFWRHNNAEIADITGRSIQEAGDKRAWWNAERNNWHNFDPEKS